MTGWEAQYLGHRLEGCSCKGKLPKTMHTGSGPELYLLHMNQTCAENFCSFPHEFSYAVHPHGILGIIVKHVLIM